MIARHGPDLFHDSIENRRLCCHVRKVNVLKRKLSGLDAWICGLRREQSVTRGDVQRIEWDQANGLIKVNPLVDWIWIGGGLFMVGGVIAFWPGRQAPRAGETDTPQTEATGQPAKPPAPATQPQKPAPGTRPPVNPPLRRMRGRKKGRNAKR